MEETEWDEFEGLSEEETVMLTLSDKECSILYYIINTYVIDVIDGEGREVLLKIMDKMSKL